MQYAIMTPPTPGAPGFIEVGGRQYNCAANASVSVDEGDVFALKAEGWHLSKWVGNPTEGLDGLLSDIRFVDPYLFGARGDGVTDDSAAFVKMRLAGLTAAGKAGKTYRFSQSVLIGDIYPVLGAYFTSDSGVAVRFRDIIYPKDYAFTIFKGAGIFDPVRRNYNPGWYDGASADAKWDFCRRGFQENAKKRIHWPMPVYGDSATHDSSEDASGTELLWKTTGPIIHDAKENNMVVSGYTAWIPGTVGQTCILEFSPQGKTEDITFESLVTVKGLRNSVDNIRIHGGARIKFNGGIQSFDCARDSVHCELDVAAVADMSECTAAWIESTGHGRAALYNDSNLTRQTLGLQCDYIFTNGAKGLWCTAVVSSSPGALTGLTINANKPNGVSQTDDLKGFVPGATYFVTPVMVNNGGAAGSNVGYGATAQLTISNTTVTGIASVDGATVVAGQKYVNGELVFVSLCESHIFFKGHNQATRVPRLYEVQENNVYGPPATGQVILEANSEGASDIYLGDIRSKNGFKPLIVSRSVAGALTGRKHRIKLDDGMTGSALLTGPNLGVNLQWATYCDVHHSYNGQEKNMVFVDSSANDINVRGIPVYYVLGTCDRMYIDGALTVWEGARATDTVKGFSVRTPGTAGIVHKRISFMSTTANVYYEGLIINGALVDILKGSLVDTGTTQPSGGTAGSGRVLIAVNNGQIFINQRTGAALDYTVQCFGR